MKVEQFIRKLNNTELNNQNTNDNKINRDSISIPVTINKNSTTV